LSSLGQLEGATLLVKGSGTHTFLIALEKQRNAWIEATRLHGRMRGLGETQLHGPMRGSGDLVTWSGAPLDHPSKLSRKDVNNILPIGI